MNKMKDVYWNYRNEAISVINLSTTGGVILNAVWKQRKEMWYVVDSGSMMKKNVDMDVLTPRQFHEAIRDGKHTLKW